MDPRSYVKLSTLCCGRKQNKWLYKWISKGV